MQAYFNPLSGKRHEMKGEVLHDPLEDMEKQFGDPEEFRDVLRRRDKTETESEFKPGGTNAFIAMNHVSP